MAVDPKGADLKLGRGGIREVEFYVQTQQLILGGRQPALRSSRTLEALRAHGWRLKQGARCCAADSCGPSSTASGEESGSLY